jgi:tRNA A-37 threonylcarbamoyl transferase component Bud32
VGVAVTARPASTTEPGSAIDALHAEEVKRTREFLRIGWIIAIGVLISLPIVPGARPIAIALAAALVIGVAGSVWMHDQLRDPTRYDPARLNALAFVGVVCGQLGILYVGAFSAAPLMVALGLYFFCRTENTASAIGIYAIAAGAHAIEAVLVITRVIDDPGFYPIGRQASLQAQIAGQMILQLSYALCFWLARTTRKTSLRSIDQLQQATRLAAQRDVQLADLRKDLDRALEVGGPGRFTGHTVGSWQLGKLLGRGAMGDVYEATDATTGAEAAVKLLRRDALAEPHTVERFLREVRIASTAESPHVVRVLEASKPTDTLPFLAMERLRGETLGDLLRKGKPLDGRALTNLVTQIGEALACARAAGIVHRDLKPQNLMFTDGGIWKVLDFGIAVLTESSGTLTGGRVIGTPAYMAPEQAKGEAVDHRADLYAFAAVIYRCISGRPPFAARDTPALLYAVVHQMPLRPSAIAPVSTAFEHVMLIALAKSRDARFGSAAELVAAFTAAADDALPDELVRRARALAREQPWSEPDAGERTEA